MPEPMPDFKFDFAKMKGIERDFARWGEEARQRAILTFLQLVIHVLCVIILRARADSLENMMWWFNIAATGGCIFIVVFDVWEWLNCRYWGRRTKQAIDDYLRG